MSTPLWSIKLGELPTVVDLSHNNSGFTTAAEFAALYAAGIRLVIHKVGQTSMRAGDPLYKPRRLLGLAAGLRWDGYWFCDDAPITAQQAQFLSLADADATMRLALDAEPNRGSTIDPAQAALFATSLDAKLGR